MPLQFASEESGRTIMEVQRLVLRCEQCDKPFDKQSTLKRHGYYCRSRKAPTTTRIKSCISCARRKVRCDNRQPGCSRCKTKGIACQYPRDMLGTSGVMIQRSYTTPIQDRSRTPGLLPSALSTDDGQVTSYRGDTAHDSDPFAFDMSLAGNGGDYLRWSDSDIDFGFFLNSPTHDTSSRYPSSGPPDLARTPTPSTSQTFEMQRCGYLPRDSIPTVPTTKVRSLNLRPETRSGPQRITNLILHTLKSYPMMMMRHKTLPPFIHPHMISSDVETDDMELLNNCISLLHMISSGVRGCRKLFWKGVRSECEQLYGENLKLNKWGLLAAMQALSIYLLVRLGEGETEENTNDVLLMATVTLIAQRICHVDMESDPWPSSNSLERSWRDWIFEESRRRLSVVYSVVDLLAFEPVIQCNPGAELVIAPLPAKRQLWEAADGLAWKTEMGRENGTLTDFALAANGELVKLDEGYTYCGDNRSLKARPQSTATENWQEWCLGMDGLGGLIMLTASLIA